MSACADVSGIAARGRTAQESRAVIRCAARGRWFPSRASRGRVHRDPRNGLPQAQQKAQKSGKHLPNTVFQFPWRARTQQFAQDQAQVECADMDQLPLQNVFVSAQMATPHAARLVAVRETALDQLPAPLQQLFSVLAANPPPVAYTASRASGFSFQFRCPQSGSEIYVRTSAPASAMSVSLL